jgi:hypothetical protein
MVVRNGGSMKKLVIAFIALSALAVTAKAQSGTPECSGSNLHLSLATAGSLTLIAPSGFTDGQVWMFGISNPAQCTTTGVAYIVDGADDTSSYYYGWALVCVVVTTTTCSSKGQIVANTNPVVGSSFAPTSNTQESLAWTSSVTLDPGIYALALGTTCLSGDTCASLYGDVEYGVWYPFVQTGTGGSGSYQWTFSSSTPGFGGFTSSNMPSTTGAPVLGNGVAAGGSAVAPPSAILY